MIFGLLHAGPAAWASRASCTAATATDYSHEVGLKFTLDDSGRLGPWWQPATWWRVGRERVRATREPRSEAGWAWHAVHSEGSILFASASAHGNGVVRVTQHGPWRCLKCDEVEQGIAYASADGTPLPQVIGYQYVRVMVAAALGFAVLAAGEDGRGEAGTGAWRGNAQRVVCVGLGTGALPGYLAHHCSSLRVEVAEIDPVVVSAAQRHTCGGFSVDPRLGDGAEAAAAQAAAAGGGFSVTVCDAAEYLGGGSEAAAGAGTLDTIFLDAYDGEGNTPPHLTEAAFLRSCGDALAPGGVLVCNLFNGARRSEARAEFARVAAALGACVGPVYSVPVATQEESVVLVARRAAPGLRPPGSRDLSAAARSAARAAGMRLDAARLVRPMLWVESADAESVVERVPPRSTSRDFGTRPPTAATLREGSSACERLRWTSSDDA